MTFDLDIYGDRSAEFALKLYNRMLSNDGVLYFQNHNIGISRDIELENIIEEINEVM